MKTEVINCQIPYYVVPTTYTFNIYFVIQLSTESIQKNVSNG